MGLTSNMGYILFDDATRFQLLPFTHTRPIADIRCGILTMRERWEKLLNEKTSTLTEPYLRSVFPLNTADGDLLINAAVFANAELVKAIQDLKSGEKLTHRDTLIAARVSNTQIAFDNINVHTGGLSIKNFDGAINILGNIWDIFSLNDHAIREDFQMITNGRKSAPIPEQVTVSGRENLFIEDGAVISAGCIINAATGPVYLGKDAEILEGCMLRGPLALGEHAVVKMGAKIYGATTIGPGCKVGGEINNVVFFANSNKAHDGFIGNAVIGEWCNLGADTNCSNLKNNYGEINIWSEHQGSLVETGLQFCGLFMGDHSKCGINTMLNTGTVVGVSANIFGGDFPEKFVPSFSWGGNKEMETYEFSRAMDTANRMMARRSKALSETEIAMYRHIYEQTASQRKTEKV